MRSAASQLSLPPSAVAQPDSGVQIEEIRNVGSRIVRQDEVSTSPVQALSDADLRADGSMSFGETGEGDRETIGIDILAGRSFGNGITNMLTPTSGTLLAYLAAAQVAWVQWAKFIVWLWAIYIVLALMMLTYAVAIGY